MESNETKRRYPQNELQTNKVLEAIEKEKRLDEIRKEVDQIGDLLGKPIDEGIKETVVFLKALNINTGQSCEGHTDWGTPWPSVLIEAENEPEERWEGQKKVFQETAEKYGISFEDVKRANNLDAWVEAINAASKRSETKDFKSWRDENEKIHKRVSSLLEEFYAERKSEEKVTIEEGSDSSFWISFPDEEDVATKIVRGEAKKEERDQANKKLPARQAEMAAFTQFLEKKYWSR